VKAPVSAFSGSGTTGAEPIMKSMPALTVTERDSVVRLHLSGLTCGEGPSLQDAADDLIRRLLGLVLAFRSGGFRCSAEARLDLQAMDFLYELGEIAAGGGDIRARVFG
jgi:hypothetical protein